MVKLTVMLKKEGSIWKVINIHDDAHLHWQTGIQPDRAVRHLQVRARD
jgi:hypothetical protein